jgi:hypothetical protein
MANPTYPITGCGRPECRTCHPSLIPDAPRESVPKLIAGVVGLLLVAVALLAFLPASAWTP